MNETQNAPILQAKDVEIKFDLRGKTLTDRMYVLARELLGPAQAVLMREPSLGADDFAFFSERVPGCYFNVGAHTDGTPGQVLHSPTFVPHEASMETALRLLTEGVPGLM